MKNRFACNCATCRATVGEGRGEAVKTSSGWRVYCRQHIPATTTTAQAPTGPRKLHGNGLLKTPYEQENLPILRSFPCARWSPSDKCWSVSVSDADLPRTLELADKLGLDVAPGLRERAATLTVQAAAVSADSRLYPFQVRGVDHLSRRPHALLADEMGLGKTVQALAALAQDGSWSVLVICPNSLKLNWVREAGKWSPKYKAEALSGRDGFRFPKQGEILTCNYDILPKGLEWRKDKPATLAVPAGITLIVDEVQYAKNSKAARSSKVRTIARNAARVWALTGTPLMNRAPDLWGVLNNTAMAGEVFGSWNKFTELYNAVHSDWGIEWGNPTIEVPERLRRVMLRRLRAEVMPDLPRKQYADVEVNGLSGALVRKLDELQDSLLADGWDTKELPPFTRFSEIRAALAESRIEALEELVEQYEESETPVVVFSAHRAPVDHLAAREDWRVITGDTSPADRQAAVDAFQSGSLRGIALTITAGGVGITLTRAAHEIFVDLDWVPANNAQAEDRLVRIGQTASSVQVTRMVSSHPLDLHIQRLLAEKIALAYASVDAAAVAVVPQKRVFRALPEAGEKPEPKLTEAQCAALADALVTLAGQCDGALAQDGAGFNKFDSRFGRSLAAAAPALNERQAQAAFVLCRKYKRQLGGLWASIYGTA